MLYKLIYSSIISIALLVGAVSAQTASNPNSSQKNWTNISFNDNELSISFPAGFLADREKREYEQVGEVIGFENDVKVTLVIFRENNGEKRLTQYLPLAHLQYSAFGNKKYKGTMSALKGSNAAFDNDISIAGKKHFYRISISSPDKSKPEISRILTSIKVKDENVFSASDSQKHTEDSVAFETLQTSPEITQAYARKFSKEKVNFTFQPDSNVPLVQSFKQYSRAPIVLDQPYPQVRPNFGSGKKSEFFEIQIKARLLADGQIGDVAILSSNNKSYGEKCAAEMRKLVFVPAQIDGVDVDAETVLVYRMGYTTSMSISVF